MQGVKMDTDTDKIDEMALALLYLTHFQQKQGYPYQAWKGMDWDVLNRLHEKGYIGDPKNKNKSIIFTDEGFQQCKVLFQKHFVINETKAEGL